MTAHLLRKIHAIISDNFPIVPNNFVIIVDAVTNLTHY